MRPANFELPAEPDSALIIPVIAETLRMDKQTVETGRVVLRKTVQTTTETADVPLRQEMMQLQRVAVNRYVDEAPAVRCEGETMIVPMLREELVVTKRLLLVEELHVHKQIITIHAPQTVELRREEITYERITTPPADAAPPAAE